jgi:hypothetical protein
MRSKNFPVFELELGFNTFWAVAILAGIIYGGLHALAWNAAQFPSPRERLLWRISASAVMCGALVELCIFKLNNEFRYFIVFLFHGRLDSTLLFLGCYLPKISRLGDIGLVFIAYFLARAYLVVECFFVPVPFSIWYL